MSELHVVYWRDIPAQVIARAGRKRAGVELAPRFAEAIDAAARAEAEGLESDYSDVRIRALVGNFGLGPD